MIPGSSTKPNPKMSATIAETNRKVFRFKFM
jgi:hypothetical protein